MRNECYDPAQARVRTEEGQAGARGRDDLLLLGARELTDDGMRNSSRWLDRQRVEEHI